MSADWQAWAAIALVILAALWLARKLLRRPRGDCRCGDNNCPKKRR